jgi:putative Mg2+ transporter-C (MgtC) family protein
MIILFKLTLAIVLGALIGFEREYRSKSAGFRTITLITLGSVLFTMIGTDTPDYHIAANIVTGVGFLGAGAIFKDGFSVGGLTTAASIWVAASVGMAVGMGEYVLACCGCGASIVILAVFEYIQVWIETFHQVHAYCIVFSAEGYEKAHTEIQARSKDFNVVVRGIKLSKTLDGVVMRCSIGGDRAHLHAFSKYLLTAPGVKSFDE